MGDAKAEKQHPDASKLYANRALCNLKLAEAVAAPADTDNAAAIEKAATLKQWRLAQCVKDCDRALLVDPRYTKAVFRRLKARVLLGGASEEAAADARAFLEEHPLHPEASELGLAAGLYSVDGKMPVRHGRPLDTVLTAARWEFNNRHANDIARVEGFPRDGEFNDFAALPRQAMHKVRQTRTCTLLTRTRPPHCRNPGGSIDTSAFSCAHMRTRSDR
jgi:hypothetical protein